MTLIQSLLLGIIQGITEFLPISSSAHLVIVPYLFNWTIPNRDAFIFDILVQVATLAAVIVYFWGDLTDIGKAWVLGLIRRNLFSDPKSRLGWLLILASIPAGVIGLALHDMVETAFATPIAVAIFLFVTAGLLFAAEKIGKRIKDVSSLTWKDALWVGFAQALAIFPGVSRSGATIAAGMSKDLDRKNAARFSFLMSVPIMLAAGLSAGMDLIKMPNLGALLPVFLPGFAAAAVVGYLAIRWLLRFLASSSLYAFSIYCVGIGLVVIVVGIFR